MYNKPVTNTPRFHLYEVPRVITFLETENRMVVARCWEMGDGELVFNGYRVSVWEDEKFWSWIVVIVVQQCECWQSMLMPLNCTLKVGYNGKYYIFFTTIKVFPVKKKTLKYTSHISLYDTESCLLASGGLPEGRACLPTQTLGRCLPSQTSILSPGEAQKVQKHQLTSLFWTALGPVWQAQLHSDPVESG